MTAHAFELSGREAQTASARRWTRSLVADLLLLTSLFCSRGSLAWGGDGHRLIAEYAGTQLSPAMRTQVKRLLALEPGATLSSVSTWADEVRSPTTAAWHYLNFPRDDRLE